MHPINKLLHDTGKKQCMEFGQVATLAAIFCALYFKNNYYIDAALVLSVVTILAPILFYPLAIIWFGISKLLSAVSPAIMMGILFFLVVTPMGVFRRLTGKDSMKLKQFKKGTSPVMENRDHLYVEADILHIF